MTLDRLIKLALVAVALLLTTACGGGDAGEIGAFIEAAQDQLEEIEEENTLEDRLDPNAPRELTPEAAGDLPMNSIRIGDQVWMRTLPMTRGQCWVTDDNGTLPASSNIWGTLDGDDDVDYSVGMTQQGEFNALVDDQQNFYWLTGARDGNGLTEITITHDFENNIARGEGIFLNLFTNELAEGSFIFQCAPDS